MREGRGIQAGRGVACGRRSRAHGRADGRGGPASSAPAGPVGPLGRCTRGPARGAAVSVRGGHRLCGGRGGPHSGGDLPLRKMERWREKRLETALI